MTATATIRPMLAQPIDERRVGQLVTNPRWACEPKVDGHRILIVVKDGRVTYLARSGKPFEGVPGLIKQTFGSLAAGGLDLVVDGELLPATGDLWLFDVLSAGTAVTPAQPFAVRRAALEQLATTGLPGHPLIHCLPSYTDEIDKARLILDIKKRGAEGVMFRDIDSPYLPKRTDRLLKYKFRYDADCVVTEMGIDGKHNMRLGLFDENGRLVDVGTCTALAGDGPLIKEGDVVCVKYLYSSPDLKLVQPTVPRLRTDKEPTDCTTDQLVFADKRVIPL